LITAVFGSSSKANRANDAGKLLTYGFRFFDTQTYAKAAQVLANPMIWKGESRTLPVGLLDDLSLTLPKNVNRKTDIRLTINEPLTAPIALGAVVGSLTLFEGDQELATRPLIALQSQAAGGWWARTWDTVKLFFLDLFGATSGSLVPHVSGVADSFQRSSNSQ